MKFWLVVDCGVMRWQTLLALLIGALCACAGASSPNATLLSRADALRESFASQLDATGRALNDVMCVAALAGLPGLCEDRTAPLWARAPAPNSSAPAAALLRLLVSSVAQDMLTAQQSIAAVADAAGGGGGVVDKVLPDAPPWGAGSTSEPTYRGERVSLSPAIHLPAHSSSDEVSAAISADVLVLSGLADTMRDVYTKAPLPLIAATVTGAAVYMPAPSRAPDARTQPWFQAAVLPPRSMIVVVDLWTSDRVSGVQRVLQVAAELLRTFVTPLDRICLKLSDDTEAAAPIALAQAVQGVKDKMLQRLALRASRNERSLFPSAKADIQAAFHFLDSAPDAQSMYNLVLLISTDAGHNNMLEELPSVATLVLFNVQATVQPSAAVRAVACAPRVVAIPIVAGAAAGPLSAAQLRAIAPAFALMTSRNLPKLGEFVVSCSRCVGGNSTAGRLAAFMELSAVVRPTKVGEFNAAAFAVAARIDLSQFVAAAIARTSHCGHSCSVSLVIASGVHAALVLATSAVLPPHAPPSPTIFDVEGAVFAQAWNAILAAPSGSINISGVYWQDDRAGVYRGLVSAAVHQAAGAAGRAFVSRTVYREVTWISISESHSRVVAVHVRDTDVPSSAANASAALAARPASDLRPLPIIPMCSRAFPPFVLGLCFDAPLVYNRIDLFAPAGVTYANGTAREAPLFSLAPVSFNAPESFVPDDPAKMNFRNVQALVEAVNSGEAPMPKSSKLVADGLTLVAEAELKALSLLANMWPSRNFTRLAALGNASSAVLQHLSSASVFAVAVASAVAFEFPGQKIDGVAAASEATQRSPAFAAALSSLNALSLTWSFATSTVVAAVPLPFPSRQSSSLPLRSESEVLAVVGVAFPVAVIDAVMYAVFPPACDGVAFLCWLLDERAHILHARDRLCADSRSCVGLSLSALRPRVASTLVSSGAFAMRAVNGSFAVFHHMCRQRSITRQTVGIPASNDDSSPASQQQLEVNVFAVPSTTAIVAVLSGAGMQASEPLAGICALCQPFSRCSQPVLDATRPGFLDCGPMGVFCSNLELQKPSPSLFYAPPFTLRAPAGPIVLTPALSSACDFSTAPWVWAVVGTGVFLFFASLCSGPVLIRLYRKRKAARLMHGSLELQAPSDPRASEQQPKAEAAAAPDVWAVASSVESFCNTSYAAEEAVLGMHRRGAGKLVELEDEVVVIEQQLTFLEGRIENFVMRLSGVERLMQGWDALCAQSKAVLAAAAPSSNSMAKSRKD